MKKNILKIVVMTGIGAASGALLGFIGQCAGST